VPDLIVYLPAHGYADDTPVYVSWLDTNYYVDDPDTDSFKLTLGTGGPNVQFFTSITDGYIREFDDSAGTTTISGLDHLEGETVKVTSGGSVVATEVVSGGSITLASDVFTYQVGLPYKMKIRTMRLSVPQEGGTMQSRIKRIHETVVRYLRSKMGKSGQEYDGVEYLSDLNTDFNTDSQDVTTLTHGGFSEDAYTVITSEEPSPFTVLATVISFEVEERR
jgi:hypothetical protein